MTDPIIRTYSGIEINLYKPTAEMIRIEDIAHGLAMKCRYGGQCPAFYSVAQHSVDVAEMLPLPLKLWGLLHDAGEAYLCDVIRPIKDDVHFHLGDRHRRFEWVENQILFAVAQAFGLPWPMPADVLRADDTQLNLELPWGRGQRPHDTFTARGLYGPAEAEALFMDRFYRLAA